MSYACISHYQTFLEYVRMLYSYLQMVLKSE